MTDLFSDQLVERARQHDPAALAQIVALYGPRVFGLLKKVTGNPDLADDLLQETFLRMVRRIADYEPTGKFESWLFSIAINLVRDHIRRNRRRGNVYSLDEAEDEGSAVAQGSPHHRSEAPPPEAIVLRAEQVARLERAFERLGPSERELLSLRHYGDLSFRDIADMLGIPLGTALARGHRALQKLRAILEETDDA
ncbi:MAG: RNA polymerase sigma factor [Phycisphaerae bacterium]